MANKALEYIDAKITSLQDQKRQAADVRAAAERDYLEKVGRFDAELADWAELLDRYHGVQAPKAVTAKKTAPRK